jgi:hypothetical protein
MQLLLLLRWWQPAANLLRLLLQLVHCLLLLLLVVLLLVVQVLSQGRHHLGVQCHMHQAHQTGCWWHQQTKADVDRGQTRGGTGCTAQQGSCWGLWHSCWTH